MDKLDIFCCYTPAHAVLFRDYFCPTLPESMKLTAYEIPIEGPGDFLTGPFLRCIRKKIELLIQSIDSAQGKIIVWSDVDIVWNGDPSRELRAVMNRKEIDIAFQSETRIDNQVNTGFVAIRCNQKSRLFFAAIREALEQNSAINEQLAANRLLADEFPIGWTKFSNRFYARTHGWPPPRDWLVYHANYTLGEGGVSQKVKQFAELEFITRFGEPARLYSMARRVPGKLLGMAEKLRRRPW